MTRFIPFVLLASLLTVSHNRALADELDLSEAHTEPFALVELFTSEGCSSCPPADKVLSKLKHAAVEDGRRVITLSYHVDYWDRLGWKDPYSDPVHSYRQRLYAGAFRSSRIYTPQMIVNGRVGFVGSDKTKAEKVIDDALEQTPTHTVTFTTEPGEADTDRVIRYKLDHVPESNTVIVAVVTEDGLSSDVSAGENNGRTLGHDSVARALVYQRVEQASGKLTLALPEILNPERLSVVVFLQDVASMRILAAELKSLIEPAAEDPERPD